MPGLPPGSSLPFLSLGGCRGCPPYLKIKIPSIKEIYVWSSAPLIGVKFSELWMVPLGCTFR